MLNIGKKSWRRILLLFSLLIILAPAKTYASDLQQTVPQAAVDIHKRKVTLKKGKKSKLAFSVANTSKRNIYWSSSNPKIVKVNSKTGKISGKEGGVAVITATVKETNISDSVVVVCKNYYKMRVKTTGYCNRRCCAGMWAGHATASGRRPRANHTIAVDRRVIPLGTKVKIGRKMYVAEDTGVRGRVIDIYYSSHRSASRHGVQYKTVTVYY